MPCKSSRAGGAPPRTDALIGPAAFGDVQKTDCLKRRASGAPSLLTLLNCGTRRSYASRFRGYALQRAPVRWTLTSEPTIGGSLRLCQSRNGATNSTIAEESFPGDVTQPSQVSTREQPKEPEPNTWHPKQRTELTRENESKNFEPALNQSKKVQTEFLTLTKLVKFDLNAVTKQRFVRDLFRVS